MERNPGIHITKSQFEEILEYLDIPNFPTGAFFVIAKKKAINSRAVCISNKRDSKKIANTLLASAGDAQLVADLLYATRIKLKHRGVRKINETQKRDWAQCKKLAEICNTFCDDFQLETREGFIEYIQIGISRMGNNLRNILQRLIQMAENITSQKSALMEMSDNRELKGLAKQIHDCYVSTIASSTGILQSFEDNPVEYVEFYRVANLIHENGWDYTNFIKAQFEALSFCNGIPTITSLCSDKSIDHYNKYLFKSNVTQEEPEVEGSLWDKIN